MGFEPTHHPERLEDPKKVKKPSRIFCGSMTDLFGEWVPKFWVHDILSIINQTPQHKDLLTRLQEVEAERQLIITEFKRARA